jgi:hypothetical protein
MQFSAPLLVRMKRPSASLRHKDYRSCLGFVKKKLLLPFLYAFFGVLYHSYSIIGYTETQLATCSCDWASVLNLKR